MSKCPIGARFGFGGRLFSFRKPVAKSADDFDVKDEAQVEKWSLENCPTQERMETEKTDSFAMSRSLLNQKRPKIYNAFLFFNELELLEIRLDELYDIVDYFVIVESDRTFTNKPKPLYFNESKSRFERFLDKIKYVYCPIRIEDTNPDDEKQKDSLLQ